MKHNSDARERVAKNRNITDFSFCKAEISFIGMARPEAEPKTELGARLREIRRELGELERDEVARAIGVSKSALASYERGESEPTVSAVALYRDQFSVNIDWLVTGEGDMFADPSKASAAELPSFMEALGPRRDVTQKIPVIGPVSADAWFFVGDDKKDSGQTIPATDTRYPIAAQSAYLVLDDALDLRGIVEYNHVISVPYWRYRHRFQIGDLAIVERWDEKKRRERSIRVVRGGDDGSVCLATDSSNPKWQNSEIIIPRGQFEVAGDTITKVTGLVVMTLRLFAARD